MAAEPVAADVHQARLRPFETPDASRVASWILNAEEMYWLAPLTPPPITSAEICSWHGPGRLQQALACRGSLVAYGEVNLLSASRREYWLGHLIVNPAMRGQGFGRELVRQLLALAVAELRANRVTLVVFPRNRAAIASYRAAGMREDGYEVHYFPAYDRREWLVRMAYGRR